MKFYEKKVFEAESERIEKERENLKLKESLIRLQAQMRQREKKKIKENCPTVFESSSAVSIINIIEIIIMWNVYS